MARPPRPTRPASAAAALLPPAGLLGCRAPQGVFAVDVPAWPPSKSNSKKIIDLHDRAGHTRKSLILSADAYQFMDAMSQCVRAELRAIGYTLEWYLPPKRKTYRPLNPLFGVDVEVDVEVHLYEALRSDADTDGVLKVTLDVLTKCGVWWDDRQVADLHILRAAHVGQLPNDAMHVIVHARPSASWTRNPTGRITNRRTAATAATPPVALQTSKRRTRP